MRCHIVENHKIVILEREQIVRHLIGNDGTNREFSSAQDPRQHTGFQPRIAIDNENLTLAGRGGECFRIVVVG